MKKKNRKDKNTSNVSEIIPEPGWKKATVWASAAWAIFVAVQYNKKFPASLEPVFALFEHVFSISPSHYLNVLPSDLKSLVLLLAIILGVVSLGSRLAPAAGLSSLEKFLFSVGIGTVILSHLIFFLGVAGFVRPDILFAFLMLFSGIGIYLGRQSLLEWRQNLKMISWKSILLSPSRLLLAVFIVIPFVMCFVPEVFYDSLVYHLGLPQMFINEGRMVNTTNVYFSRFPMFMHMLYVLGVGLDGSTLAKLLNWFMMLMGMGAVVCICCRLKFPGAAPWANIFVFSMPVIQLVNWTTAVDTALGSFTAMAVLAFMTWINQENRPFGNLFLTGLFAGAIFSIKYTGAVAIIVLLLFIIISAKWIPDGWRKIPRWIVIFGFASFIVAVPYLVRNVLWTGNPTYPIMSGIFKNHLTQKLENEKSIIGRAKPRTLAQWVKFPWTQTFADQSSFNFIGPMTLAGLPLLLLAPFYRRRDWLVLGFITASYFFLSLLFSGDIRYLVPGFFLLSGGLGYGVDASGKIDMAGGVVLKAVFFALGLYQLTWLLTISYVTYQPVDVLLGVESRDAYTSKTHNGLNLYPWQGMMPVLKELPDTSRVMVVGTEQVYGFPKRFWYSSVHDETPLVQMADQSRSGQELYEKLKAAGFTHILFNGVEAIRLKGYFLFNWTDQGRASFIEFAETYLRIADVRSIDEYKNALFLFEIKDNLQKQERLPGFAAVFRDLMNLGAPQ